MRISVVVEIFCKRVEEKNARQVHGPNIQTVHMNVCGR
jgi:hypothetical protein